MGKTKKKKVVTIRRVEEIDLDDMEDDEPYKSEEVEIVLDEDGEEDDG